MELMTSSMPYMTQKMFLSTWSNSPFLFGIGGSCWPSFCYEYLF